jgi:hypothetical protein
LPQEEVRPQQPAATEEEDQVIENAGSPPIAQEVESGVCDCEPSVSSQDPSIGSQAPDWTDEARSVLCVSYSASTLKSFGAASCGFFLILAGVR